MKNIKLELLRRKIGKMELVKLEEAAALLMERHDDGTALVLTLILSEYERRVTTGRFIEFCDSL